MSLITKLFLFAALATMFVTNTFANGFLLFSASSSKTPPTDVTPFGSATQREVNIVESCHYDTEEWQTAPEKPVTAFCRAIVNQDPLRAYKLGLPRASFRRLTSLYRAYRISEPNDRELVFHCFNRAVDLSSISKPVPQECSSLLFGRFNVTVMVAEKLRDPSSVSFGDLEDLRNQERRPWAARRQMLRARFWKVCVFCEAQMLTGGAAANYEWCLEDTSVPVPRPWVMPPQN